MKGILTDNDGDLASPLQIGKSSEELATQLLVAYPGEFKEEPLAGLFVAGMSNGVENPFWRGRAKKQLRTYGVEAKSINISSNGEITIVCETLKK